MLNLILLIFFYIIIFINNYYRFLATTSNIQAAKIHEALKSFLDLGVFISSFHLIRNTRERNHSQE